MSNYSIHAIRYATAAERKASQNFIGGDPHDGPMPLDFFVWVISDGTRTILIDTGFDETVGKIRGREISRPVVDGLKIAGFDPNAIEDIVITHMHYDHCGNHSAFPRARYHVQEREMAYCTGRCMCHSTLRHPYEVGDVTSMVARLFEGRVQFHDGASEIAPGISVHLVGGHARGLQVVRVRTERGWVVLASDASHFYANYEQKRLFPIVVDVPEMVDGWETMKKLASGPDHIIPGHDPMVLSRYQATDAGPDGIVRLDRPPRVI
jgi:glyoxylase-like metal-dependent hydrolase (beta-lactamase superfamily II)